MTKEEGRRRRGGQNTILRLDIYAVHIVDYMCEHFRIAALTSTKYISHVTQDTNSLECSDNFFILPGQSFSRPSPPLMIIFILFFSIIGAFNEDLKNVDLKIRLRILFTHDTSLPGSHD